MARFRSAESWEWTAEEYEPNPRLAEIWQVVPFSGKVKGGRLTGCDLMGGRKVVSWAALDEARFTLAEAGVPDTWDNLLMHLEQAQGMA